MVMILQYTLLAFSPWIIAVSATGLNATQLVAAHTFVAGPWTLIQKGTTGVAGQQLAVVSETKVVIYDKVEHNPLTTNGHLAWAVEYDLPNNTPRALNPLSNSWCAGGAHLSNGTLVDTGGNPVILTGDINGLQAIRMYTPCETDECDIKEYPTRVRLASNRWYSSVARLDDGSVIIFGGSVIESFANSASINNPTYEFFPPKNINGYNGLPIPNVFLRSTLNANHFPIMFTLPDGTLFLAANQAAMIFNWRNNVEIRLPGIPNGVRVSSPFSASAVLLPLTPANGYTPEVLICGGSTVSDTVDPSTISSQTPTSRQCIRMVLNTAGISEGWKVESMPQGRVMLDAILLPDGRVLIINGAQTGVAGYANVGDQVGQSNADHPAFTATVYNPAAPAGSRFSSSGIPASSIARLYHSVATLTPNATIFIAGSNPNNDFSTAKYPTEYRVETLLPAYLSEARPTYTGLPAVINFGVRFTLYFTLPPSVTSVTVSLMDLGFSTHGVHMDQRLVQLASTLSADRTTLTVTAPPSGTIYSPGPGYVYVVTNTGVPSFGYKTIIGTGESPPVDQGAIDNMLSHTAGPNADAPYTQGQPPATGEGSWVHTSPIPAPQ